MSAKLSLHVFRNMGLAAKFSAATAITLVVLLSLGASLLLSSQSRTLNDLLGASSDIMEEISADQIASNRESEQIKVTQLAKMLAEIAPSAIASFDLSALLNYAKVATEDPDISYVAFISTEGNVLGEAGDKANIAADAQVERPIRYEEELLGKVMVGFNHQRAEAQINKLKDNNAANLAQMDETKEDAYRSAVISLVLLVILITIAAVAVIFIITRNITRPLGEAVDAAKRIADGDLTVELSSRSHDETGQLLDAMQSMLEGLNGMVHQITAATGQLGTTADQMTEVTQQTSEGAQQQQAETNQLASAMDEMSATVQEVARNATDAAQAAQHADQAANAGKREVGETIDVINNLVDEITAATNVVHDLQTETDNIGSVLDVIRGIAEQTNLLALNAAIEAARAGEQGRGFAVVADEVRTLASRTQESTQEIQDMIERLQSGASNAVTSMESSRDMSQSSAEKANSTGDSLEQIVTAVATISEMNTQIASAAEQQGVVAEEINRNVTSIRDVAGQTAANAHNNAEASTELEGLSLQLRDLVGRFQV
jgi:methyl-accepting chemotaxis protein